MPENQDPMLIVATPSLSLDALVRFPQPPIQAELFGSSPVLSFTSLKVFNKTVTLRGGSETEFSSLIEELQVAVAEQELLVEESALPESFLLASSKAEATSILVKLLLKSNPLSLSVPKLATHSLRACPRPATSFSQLSSHFCVLDVTKCVDIKGCHTPASFSSSSLEPARVWSRPGRRPCLQHVCYCVAAGGSSPSCSEAAAAAGGGLSFQARRSS